MSAVTIELKPKIERQLMQATGAASPTAAVVKAVTDRANGVAMAEAERSQRALAAFNTLRKAAKKAGLTGMNGDRIKHIIERVRSRHADRID